MRAIIQYILRWLGKNYYLFKAAEQIVFAHKNENNADCLTNGEATFLQTRAGNCVVIFDVGAHVGEWSALAHKFNPIANVYAFEPFYESFTALRQRLFKSGSVSCYNIALGDRAGTRELFVYVEAPTLNSLYKRQLPGVALRETVLVPVTTVDAFCAEQGITAIDILKIDVEGSELEVLRGAANMIGQGKIRIIQFEYGGTYIDARILLKDVFDFFKDTPYALYKLFSTRLVACPKYDQRLENFQYANYVALLE